MRASPDGHHRLQAIYKGPNTSKKHPQHLIWQYLLRKLSITRPSHVWCSDITYIPVKNDLLYLVAIMDWTTRKVLSWWLSNTVDARFCVNALDVAIAEYALAAPFEWSGLKVNT